MLMPSAVPEHTKYLLKSTIPTCRNSLLLELTREPQVPYKQKHA